MWMFSCSAHDVNEVMMGEEGVKGKGDRLMGWRASHLLISCKTLTRPPQAPSGIQRLCYVTPDNGH